MVRLEVETKIRLDSKEVADLRKRILKIAKLDKKIKKSDDYFAIRLGNKKLKKYPDKAFRIRYDGSKYIVNFKKWLKKYWTKEIVIKEEHEFEIKNLNEFLSLMKDLGFKKWLNKLKISESYIYKKNKKVNIEINKVDYLGYFMEIEYLAELKERKKAVKTIYNILKILDIDMKNVINVGYTKMLWNRGKVDEKYFLD